MTSTAPQQTDRAPLAGVRVCLIFEYNLSHHTRYIREIAALQEAGATVQLLTSHPDPADAPPGVPVTIAPLEVDMAAQIGPSVRKNRLTRFIDNKLRSIARADVRRRYPAPSHEARRRTLRKLKSDVDIFWVSDYLSLPTTLEATRGSSARVVYETVDLVPEYPQHGEEHRRAALAGEREIVGQVDGFITACDSYADYYVEQYGGKEIDRRPVVCDNMPDHAASEVRPTSHPFRLVFFGQLMFDRPVGELVEAMALVKEDVTLTLQGKNHLGDEPHTRIKELGVEERVIILDPCAPADIVETASQYDVGIVALRGTNENERRAATSKLFTYVFAGLAVLGSNLPGIARVVNEHQNGILVDGMEPTAWAAAIDKLATMPPSEIDAMKRRSLDASAQYSWERQKPLFIAEFQRALGREKSGGAA